MLQDTIIAVIMCILPSHHVERGNRFEQLFHEADSAFEAKYQLNEKLMKELERAAKETAISADRKTAKQREEVMNSLSGLRKVAEELKKQSIYIFRYNENK